MKGQPSRNPPIREPRTSGWFGAIAALALVGSAVASPPAHDDRVSDVLHGSVAGHLVDGELSMADDEFNLYLSKRLETSPIEGLESVTVEFIRGAVRTQVVLDVMATMSGKTGVVMPGLESGPAVVLVEEGLGVSGGRLQYTFRRASVGGFPLPRLLLESLATDFLGAAEPVRLTGDMPLWPGIESVEVLEGRIEFRGAGGAVQ